MCSTREKSRRVTLNAKMHGIREFSEFVIFSFSRVNERTDE